MAVFTQNETVIIVYTTKAMSRCKLLFVSYLYAAIAWKSFFKLNGSFIAKIKPMEKLRDLRNHSLFAAFPADAVQFGGQAVVLSPDHPQDHYHDRLR